MKKEISASIIINASATKAWEVLTDFEEYPNWNPFIKSIKGKATVGERLEVNVAPPDAKGMVFKPKVLRVDINKEFTWLGHFIMSGLFDGKHSFEINDNGDGSCTFIQSEKFNGILVPLFKKMIEVNTKNGFQLMNKALKNRVEL
jgi:hypothetical protein